MTVLLPAWLQTGSYSAEVDRSIATGLLMPAAAVTARSGVRRWAGTEFQVSVTNPASMQVLVRPGMAWIQGVFSSTQGVYAIVNDNDVTMTIATAPTSGSRIDLIILEVLDSVYSGSLNQAQLRVVTGTSSGTPQAPVVGGSYIVLARITVTTNATSIGTSAINDVRPYSTANGGVLPVKDSNERVALTNVPAGTLALEVATLRVWQRSVSGWDYVFGGTTPSVSLTPANGWVNYTGTYGGGPWEDLRLYKANNIVYLTGLLGNSYAFSNTSLLFTIPAGYRPERRKIFYVETGFGGSERLDIATDGTVTCTPGAFGRTHTANDYWCINVMMPLNNNTVG